MTKMTSTVQKATSDLRNQELSFQVIIILNT